MPDGQSIDMIAISSGEWAGNSGHALAIAMTEFSPILFTAWKRPRFLVIPVGPASEDAIMVGAYRLNEISREVTGITTEMDATHPPDKISATYLRTHIGWVLQKFDATLRPHLLTRHGRTVAILLPLSARTTTAMAQEIVETFYQE